MRIPVKSETDAFRLTFAVAVVVAIAVALGVGIGAVAGIVFAGVAVGAAVAWEVTSRDRAPLVEPAEAGREGGGHRILLIANEAVADDAVWDTLCDGDGARPVVEVLAPVLQSRTHFVTTDIDGDTDAARRRLEATLAAARRHGLRADGAVGDPLNPLESLADELRRYEVDEIIVATHQAADRNWIEDDILGRVREELEAPVRHVII